MKKYTANKGVELKNRNERKTGTWVISGVCHVRSLLIRAYDLDRGLK